MKTRTFRQLGLLLLSAFQLVNASAQLVNQNILTATTNNWTSYTAYMYTASTLTYVANGTNPLTYFGTNNATPSRWDWFTNGVLAATNTGPAGAWFTLAGAAYGKSQWLTNLYINTAPGVVSVPGVNNSTNAPTSAPFAGYVSSYAYLLVDSNGVILSPSNFVAINGLGGGSGVNAGTTNQWRTDATNAANTIAAAAANSVSNALATNTVSAVLNTNTGHYSVSAALDLTNANNTISGVGSGLTALNGANVSLATDQLAGALGTNWVDLFQLAARSTKLSSPPNRYCTWYGNYAGGGVAESSSNVVWKVANLITNYGLDKYDTWIVQRDDGWTTNRDATGRLCPGTNAFGTDPFYGITNLSLIIHSMSPNLGQGGYYEIRADGKTSAGYTGTDQAHIQQDATNAVYLGDEYVKLDGTGLGAFTGQQRLAQIAQFSYWFKSTAAGLGKRAVVKVDLIGNQYQNITNLDMGLLSSAVDVWGYGGDLRASLGGGFFNQYDYLYFQTNFHTGFLPMYNLLMSKGSWMDWEGLVFGHCPTCGYTTNALAGELSLDASIVMFNMARENLGPDNSDSWMLVTNTPLTSAWRNFSTKAQLVYADPLDQTNEVWKRDLGNGSYLLWFWNLQFSNSTTISLTAAQLGLPTTCQNYDLFYNFTGMPASTKAQTYFWTNSLSVTLWPAQSHLVICTPLGSTALNPPIWVSQANFNNAQLVGAGTSVGSTGSGFAEALLELNSNNGWVQFPIPSGLGFTNVVSYFTLEGYTDAGANGQVTLSTLPLWGAGTGLGSGSQPKVTAYITNGINNTVYSLTNSWANDNQPRMIRLYIDKTGASDNLTNRVWIDQWVMKSQ